MIGFQVMAIDFVRLGDFDWIGKKDVSICDLRTIEFLHSF